MQIIIKKMTTAFRDPIAYAYSGQDGGASLPYFMGKQYGAGWLQNVARFAFPIVKKALGMAGKVAVNTAEDLIEQRKSFKESLKDNAVREVGKVMMRKRSAPRSSINKAKKYKTQHTIFSKRR